TVQIRSVRDQAAVYGVIAIRINRRQFVASGETDDELATSARSPWGYDNAAIARTCECRQISSVLRTSNGVSSISSDCATDLTAANSPMPAAAVGSRTTKARDTWGAICLSNSAHLPPMLYSKFEKPVILPPGCAMLRTKPAPTGSGTFMNTIGIVRVACCSGGTVTLPTLKITSGASATSSAASRR